MIGCRSRDRTKHWHSSEAPGVEENEEVLLDMEHEGSRYLLVRLPKPGGRVQLSPREQEIVRMVAEGHPNKIIADVLNISCWTVCTYLRRIFAKLGVNSRAAMVARLAENGRGFAARGTANPPGPARNASNLARH